MDVSTVVNVIKTAVELGRAVGSVTKAPGNDQRVRRWRELVVAHGLDPFAALIRLGVADVSPAVTTDDRALADALTGHVLRSTAQTFNVRFDWLIGLDDRRYDLVTLDESFTPLLGDLIHWHGVGTGHAIVVFKSRKAELEDEPSQQGALALMREMDGGSDEHPTFAFWPVYSLRSWAESKQRWLAFRAIWAAWHLGFIVRGYEASERQCDRLRRGNAFLGSVRTDWGVGTWHPDDYVVRPSAVAKGDDSFVRSLGKSHRNELREGLAASGCSFARLD